MESLITYRKDGTAQSFSGPDATNYFRAVLLLNSLRLYVRSGLRIIPTRGVTGPKMLKMATGYTGKVYKRGQYELAANDLDIWAKTMKAALPTETV